MAAEYADGTINTYSSFSPLYENFTVMALEVIISWIVRYSYSVCPHTIDTGT